MQDGRVWIYVLRLQDDKYYVGKTSKLEKRLQDHREGNGSHWTSLYPFVEVVESFEGDAFDEDKYVKKYMAEHGIDNVRGGSYVRQHLSPEDEAALKKELIGASDSCFRCGRNTHFASQCYAKTHLDGHSLVKKKVRRPRVKKVVAESSYDSSEEEEQEIALAVRESLTTIVAERPPPPSKAVVEAPAAKLKMAKPCQSCRGDHDILDCPTKGEICYRCGSREHWKITCTATKDVNGYPLEFEVLGHVGATLKSWFW
ncbi:MAG: GIY-YIG nuclease family protein [Nitrosomonas sp.]|nr:GIY-YIG nuclease family protein [Nitrosomonas sp.]